MAGPAFYPDSPYLESASMYTPFMRADVVLQQDHRYTEKSKPKKLQYNYRMKFEAMSVLFTLYLILHAISLLLFIMECFWCKFNLSKFIYALKK